MIIRADRPARNVHFLAGQMEAWVDFFATVHIPGVVDEGEAGGAARDAEYFGSVRDPAWTRAHRWASTERSGPSPGGTNTDPIP